MDSVPGILRQISFRKVDELLGYRKYFVFTGNKPISCKHGRRFAGTYKVEETVAFHCKFQPAFV